MSLQRLTYITLPEKYNSCAFRPFDCSDVSRVAFLGFSPQEPQASTFIAACRVHGGVPQRFRGYGIAKDPVPVGAVLPPVVALNHGNPRELCAVGRFLLLSYTIAYFIDCSCFFARPGWQARGWFTAWQFLSGIPTWFGAWFPAWFKKRFKTKFEA